MHAWIGDAISFGANLVGIGRRGLRNALDVRSTYLELQFANLPQELDGYRIAHVSDLHVDMHDSITDSITSAVARESVDIFVMTGDYQKGYRGDRTLITERLHQIINAMRTKDGIFAILGNHDDADVESYLTAAGATVLCNESVLLQRNGAKFVVTGCDDVHHFDTEAVDEIGRMTREAWPGDFKIALVHSAEAHARFAAMGYDLYLCGHTHGGQVCLPFGIPLVTMQTVGRRFARGLWRSGKMTGYTTSGAGVVGAALRFNCPGEVMFITLRRERET